MASLKIFSGNSVLLCCSPHAICVLPRPPQADDTEGILDMDEMEEGARRMERQHSLTRHQITQLRSRLDVQVHM